MRRKVEWSVFLMHKLLFRTYMNTLTRWRWWSYDVPESMTNSMSKSRCRVQTAARRFSTTKNLHVILHCSFTLAQEDNYLLHMEQREEEGKSWPKIRLVWLRNPGPKIEPQQASFNTLGMSLSTLIWLVPWDRSTQNLHSAPLWLLSIVLWCDIPSNQTLEYL